MMKKIAASLFMLTAAAAGCIGASADGVSPATGQQISPVPYILGGVALVLIIAIAVLSFINNKKNKK